MSVHTFNFTSLSTPFSTFVEVTKKKITSRNTVICAIW